MQTPPRVIGHRNTVTPPSSSSRRNTALTDRFIPSRAVTNLDEAFDILENRHQFDEANTKREHPHDLLMTNMLRSELLGQAPVEISHEAAMIDGKLKSPHRRDSSSSLFKYRGSQGSTNTMPDEYDDINTLGTPSNRRSTSSLAGVSSRNSARGSIGGSTTDPSHHRGSSETSRKISRTPYKVLDAPLLQDDYYLNLLDWSQGNVLAVALGASVYLWSAATAKVSRLCDLSIVQTDSAANRYVILCLLTY